jgi:hypothetical protein
MKFNINILTPNVTYHCQNPLELTSWTEFVNKEQYTFIKKTSSWHLKCVFKEYTHMYSECGTQQIKMYVIVNRHFSGTKYCWLSGCPLFLLYPLFNKNQASWNFLSPELKVTWLTVAIITRVVFSFYTFLNSWRLSVFHHYNCYVCKFGKSKTLISTIVQWKIYLEK